MNTLLRTVSAAAFCLVAAAQAHASNVLIATDADPVSNRLVLDVAGNFNVLDIVQRHEGTGAANTLSVSIQGNLNGGPLGATFSAAPRALGLSPGSILQEGFGNSMQVDVSGSGNLFAFAQTGSGNMLSAAITGSNNQAAVLQIGQNNVAAFSQTGIGNIVSISQTSW